MAYYNPRSDTTTSHINPLDPLSHQGQSGDPAHGGGLPDREDTQQWLAQNTGQPVGMNQPTGTRQLIDQSLYGVPNADALRQAMLQQYGNIQGQTPFTAQGAQMAPLQQALGVNIGPAAQSQAVQMGAAQRAAGVNLGPAAQSADSSFRQGQQDTASYLNDLMTGKNSAAAVNGQMQASQLMAQQAALAASARPGQGGMAQRQAAQSGANLGAQLNSNTLAAQLQERANAASQLNGLLGTARGQDLSNNQFNAGQSNQMALGQGQLNSATNIANMQSGNAYNLGVGNLQSQNDQFNAGQQNSQAQAQGTLNASNNQFNAGQGNTYAYNQANLGQQNNQFNATSQNTQQTAQNQALYNQMLAQLQLAQQQQQGGIANANNQNAYNMNLNNNRTQWDIANLNHVGVGSQLLGAGAGALPWLAQQLSSSDGGNGGGGVVSDDSWQDPTIPASGTGGEF